MPSAKTALVFYEKINVLLGKRIQMCSKSEIPLKNDGLGSNQLYMQLPVANTSKSSTMMHFVALASWFQILVFDLQQIKKPCFWAKKASNKCTSRLISPMVSAPNQICWKSLHFKRKGSPSALLSSSQLSFTPMIQDKEAKIILFA